MRYNGERFRRLNAERGWTKQDILDTIKNGTPHEAINKMTGASATEYVNAATGKFVVVDKTTGQVIQVSKSGYLPNYLELVAKLLRRPLDSVTYAGGKGVLQPVLVK